MTDRQTTHAPGCWEWGPEHYECAVREIKALREVLQVLVNWTPSADTYRRMGFNPEVVMRAHDAAKALLAKPTTGEVVMQPTSKPREGVFLRHNGKIVERRDQEVSILIKTRCPEKWVMVDTETGEMWRFEDGVGFSRISLQEIEGVAALAASVLKSNGVTEQHVV